MFCVTYPSGNTSMKFDTTGGRNKLDATVFIAQYIYIFVHALVVYLSIYLFL